MDGGTSSQQDCKSPTEIDGQNFPQEGRVESPQEPPSSINTEEEQQDGEEPPQRPPSYSAVFPHGLPGSQAPMPPGMDPLIAAIRHNETYSRLHKLPEPVLIQIIRMLDNSGVECMRRVARDFPYLCHDIIFERPGVFLPTEKGRGESWSWPRLGSMCATGQGKELLKAAEGRAGLPEDRTQLMSLLDRDRYCDGCRAAREAPDWGQRTARLRKFLHCSKCVADHPACLFSHSQRMQKPHRRFCIAHEGYLRICGHEEGIIRLSDVENYEDKQTPGEKSVPLQCKDNSHIITCEGTTVSEGVMWKSSALDPGCHVAECQEYIHPSFQVGDKKICLNWTAHLPLGDTEWPVTAAALRPRLTELRDNVGRFICPPLAAGVGMDFPELCCFDPNSCDCVYFEDPLHNNSRSEPKQVRHTDPTECLFPLEAISPPKPESRVKQSKKCEFQARSHGRWRQHTTGMYGPGISNIRAQPCHTGSHCLVVRYSRTIDYSNDKEINPHLYQALDSDSYSLTDDRDGLGVYWCRQQRCRNYYGRIPGFSSIIYGQEYSIFCPRSCE